MKLLVVVRTIASTYDYVESFFFSSRRRHTRFDCDWSSDVCSSDLPRLGTAARRAVEGRTARDRSEDGDAIDSLSHALAVRRDLPGGGRGVRRDYRLGVEAAGIAGRAASRTTLRIAVARCSAVSMFAQTLSAPTC